MDIKSIKKSYLVTGIVAVIALIAGIALYSSYSSAQAEGVWREAQLSAQYESNQSELSKYILTFREVVGVAVAGNKQVGDILKEAIEGRLTTNGPVAGAGSLFGVLTVEAPDLTKNLELYSKVQDFVIAGREKFHAVQVKLVDMVGQYEVFLYTGPIHAKMVSAAGYPSQRLVAKTGGKTDRGVDALDAMRELVKSAEGNKAYETKEQAPLTIPTS